MLFTADPIEKMFESTLVILWLLLWTNTLVNALNPYDTQTGQSAYIKMIFS